MTSCIIWAALLDRGELENAPVESKLLNFRSWTEAICFLSMLSVAVCVWWASSSGSSFLRSLRFEYLVFCPCSSVELGMRWLLFHPWIKGRLQS